MCSNSFLAQVFFMTNAKRSQVDKIRFLGKTPQELFQRGDFIRKGYTLAEELEAYRKDPAFRNKVHADYEKGIWTPEVILTDGAKELPNGFFRYKWVRRPNGIYAVQNLITEEEEIKTEGGEEFSYDCPPSGFRVPATSGRFKGMLYHPETGAAVATITDRSMAAERITVYMKNHEADFKWEIPDGTVTLWGEQAFGKKFDPKNPTPEQLALVETSYQWRPETNVGPRPVRRGFWYLDNGPFDVSLSGDLSHQDDCVGVRLR